MQTPPLQSLNTYHKKGIAKLNNPYQIHIKMIEKKGMKL